MDDGVVVRSSGQNSEKKGEFKLWWKSAWFLRAEGFHEARLSAEQVKDDVEYVEKIVEAASRRSSG